LPQTRVTVPLTTPQQTPQKQEAAQPKPDQEESAVLDLKHDWYQNFSHVFVSYKIKKGGEALKNGGIKVTFTPSAVEVENL